MTRKTLNHWRAALAAAAIAIAACGDPQSDAPVPGSAGPESGDDLAPGSTGPAVADLHRYLGRYGYFPDDHLARDYPAWRPIVAQPPHQMDVFDQNTLLAVRALQAESGLPPTGRKHVCR